MRRSKLTTLRAIVEAADRGEFPVGDQRAVVVLMSRLRDWGIAADDPRATDILDRYQKLWLRISPADLTALLTTAERIATAEQAKSEWRIKSVRAKHLQLAREAIAAAKLVRDLHRTLPATDTTDRACIGELAESLASFVVGSLQATTIIERDLQVFDASNEVKKMKRPFSRKVRAMPWSLIRDLASLASGGVAEPDERTVRRYLERPRFTDSPCRLIWSSNWGLIREIAPHASREEIESFEQALRIHLKS